MMTHNFIKMNNNAHNPWLFFLYQIYYGADPNYQPKVSKYFRGITSEKGWNI
jgi:hypothetical protein